MDDPQQVVDAYKEKFGDVPTTSGLSEDQYARAIELLAEAVELGVPYEDDADFYEALGLDPPPAGADI